MGCISLILRFLIGGIYHPLGGGRYRYSKFSIIIGEVRYIRYISLNPLFFSQKNILFS